MGSFASSYREALAGKPARSNPERVGRVFGTALYVTGVIAIFLWIGWWCVLVYALVTAATQVALASATQHAPELAVRVAEARLAGASARYGTGSIQTVLAEAELELALRRQQAAGAADSDPRSDA